MAHHESDLENKWTVKKLSFVDNKPVEFDALSKIHANIRNGPSCTILKLTCNHYQNGPRVLLYYSTETQV